MCPSPIVPPSGINELCYLFVGRRLEASLWYQCVHTPSTFNIIMPPSGINELCYLWIENQDNKTSLKFIRVWPSDYDKGSVAKPNIDMKVEAFIAKYKKRVSESALYQLDPIAGNA